MDAGSVVRFARAVREVALEFAEASDAWRVFPRLFVSGYGYLAWDTHLWVKSLAAASKDLTVAQAGYVAAVVGLCVPLLGLYMSTGRRWADRQPMNITVVGSKPDEVANKPS